MKKKPFIPILLFIICACADKNSIRMTHVSDEKTASIASKMWQAADSSRFYYDLYVTDAYYLFLDDKSDTVIRIYAKDNPNVIQNCSVQYKKQPLIQKLHFLKTNTRYEAKKNQAWIVENKTTIKTLNPDNLAGPLVSEAISTPFSALPNSTDYHITTNEIYAAPVNYNYRSPFFIFRPDSGYIRAEIHKHPDLNYPQIGLAYLTNLTVCEEKNSVVAAQRFMNDVLFYDLAGNLQAVVSYGEGHVVPKIKNNTIDMDNSQKYFIYICGTKNHVYCLYDGSTDYTAQSKILVFDWHGKHIKTYQTDRCLKQIAVNKEETKIIALAANEQSGRDVVSYQIKNK